MPEEPIVMPVVRVPVSEADADELTLRDEAVSTLKGRIRSCDKNRQSFAAFIEEADEMLAMPSMSEADKKRWADRKAHCEKTQIPSVQNEKSCCESLLATAETRFTAAKAKHGPTLAKEDGNWTVEGV